MLKKKLDELTLKDNFMFCAVMADVDNCRGFLEMCLGSPLEGWRSAVRRVWYSGRTGKFFGICEGGFAREPEGFRGRLCDAASGFDPPDKIKQGDGG